MSQMSRVERFTCDWNQDSQDVMFTSVSNPETGRVSTIEVRFAPLEGAEYDWEEICGQVGSLSRYNMIVGSEPEMIGYGIIDLKVASMKHNYDEGVIIGVLRWLATWLTMPSAEEMTLFDLLEVNEE